MQNDRVVGNLIIGQSGGPTAVINASLAGVLDGLRAGGFAGTVFGMSGGIEQFLGGREPLNLSNLSTTQTAQLKETSAAALGSCRVKLGAAEYDSVLKLFSRHNISYFVYIGGNGSMNTPYLLEQAAQAAGYPLACLGIPKTVDNDLMGTDHAPGFGSAARWLAMATLDSGLDLYTMRGFDQFKVIEAMGRHCGWMAAATLLARFSPNDPPHLVLVPEVPFDEATFLAQVEQIYRREGCVLVVASEGLRDRDGNFLAELQAGQNLRRDTNGQTLLSIGEGVSAYLCNLVSNKLGMKARYDKPGTLQRGAACVSPVDREEAYQLGYSGAGWLLQGKSGMMAGLKRVSDEPYQCEVVAVPLSEVIGRERHIPEEFFNNGSIDEGKVKAYVGPLIGPALPAPFRF